MDLIHEAFSQLYAGKQLEKQSSIKYSGKFKEFNANVRITPFSLEFKLSREWKGVNREIQIGLIQSLLNKIYRTKNHTMNIDLYNIFVKRLEKVVPKTKYDPILAQSFLRNNEKYFYGTLDLPNLRWGSESFRRLGSYDFHTDTVTISGVLMHQPREQLDYVMYHEMLHKKLKYRNTGFKALHHSKEFKDKEKEFENSARIEKELGNLSYMRGKKQLKFLDYYKRIKDALF